MKNELFNKISFDDHLGCFGNFDREDPICKKHCVLSLRCAIEQDQDARMELLEDLISADRFFLKIQ
jgi:hypothetical protein